MSDQPTPSIVFKCENIDPSDDSFIRSLDGTVKTLKELCRNDRVDLHFGRDAKGELYILTKADGKIYKLVSAK